LNGREVASSFFRIAAASIVMAAVSYASYRFLLSMFPGRTLPVRLVEALVPIALGGVSFLLAAKLLGVSELEKLYTSLRRKLAR
jgi:putative peptidoglycan lipid II flippase